jgi:hypothetical protein
MSVLGWGHILGILAEQGGTFGGMFVGWDVWSAWYYTFVVGFLDVMAPELTGRRSMTMRHYQDSGGCHRALPFKTNGYLGCCSQWMLYVGCRSCLM